VRGKASALACGLMLSACQTPPGPVPAEHSGSGLSAEAVADWSQLVGQRNGLRARARFSVDAEEGEGGGPTRIRSRQRLSLERPSRLRVSMQGPLRTPVALLITDGARYELRGADGSHESGSVHRALLRQLTGLDLDPEQAVNLLLGMPRLSDHSGSRQAVSLPGGGLRVEVQDVRGLSAVQLDFDAQGRLRAFESGSVAPALVVTFDDYASVDGSPFAHRIEVVTGGARARLQLWDVELNPELAADSFRVDAARGSEPSRGQGG
jgi:hypothetical protein